MKSKGVAYLLLILFGTLGFHRFYIGKVGTGILYLLTGGLFLVGVVIDLFTLGIQVEVVNLKDLEQIPRLTRLLDAFGRMGEEEGGEQQIA